MGGENQSRKVSIPGWQKPDYEPPKGGTSSTPADELPLLDRAKKFLEDESIRNESRERKVEFLEKKGLRNDDIQKLLEPENESTSTGEEETELTTVHESNTPTIQDGTQSEPAQANAGPAAPRDIPPIITYPEFLLKSQKPPPLVTWQRLAHAAYGFAGLSALTYVASNYLVQPLLENLTAARHELAETAIQDLQKLNSKLEVNVSHVSYIKSTHHEQVDDAESLDSDPTELFHRDVATQTSPILTPYSQPLNDPSTTQTPQDTITLQSTRLRTMHSALSALASSADEPLSSTMSLQTSISDFQTFLQTIQYSSSHRPDFSNLYSEGSRPSKSAHDVDEAAKLKAEIRALKGVFLSSRNFPSGRTVGIK